MSYQTMKCVYMKPTFKRRIWSVSTSTFSRCGCKTLSGNNILWLCQTSSRHVQNPHDSKPNTRSCFHHLYNSNFYKTHIIHYIATASRNLLGKLVYCLVYLHYVLCTVALAIKNLGKIKCIFYNGIVNK